MNNRLRELFLRLLGTFRGGDHDLQQELQFHMQMAEQDAARRGDPVREARLRAGGVSQAAEAVRDQRTLAWLSDFFRDSRHGARLLARSPLFTAAATLSLALGIGANTAIFSLIDTVMLRSMPVRDPGQLVQFIKYREPYGRGAFSYPLFDRVRRESHSFDGILARAPMGKRDVFFDSEPEAMNVEVVTGNYYSLLGVSASIGRTFDEVDDRAAAPVAVISHALWRRRFGTDPRVVGRTFRLNRTVFTIAGVAPPEFFGVAPGESPDITFPLMLDGEVRGGESWLRYDSRGWLSAIGRLGRGHSLAAANAEVATIFSRVVQAEAAAQPKERFRKQALTQRMRLDPAASGLDSLRERFSEPLRMLMGIVAMVLLIACANLANLLLGRAASRQREIAVRMAIGAGRGRVMRQMFAEGLLLATAGGALGVILACWSANALVTMMSNGGDRIALDIHPDLRVLAFAAAASIAACLLFSLAPAIQASKQAIQTAQEARGGTRWRLGRGLIGAQVAISLLLLIGAGLFGRTLVRLYGAETGFQRDHILLFSVDANRASLRGLELQSRLLDDLRNVPGVASSSFAMAPVGKTGWDGSIRIEGYTHAPNEDDKAVFDVVSAGYFKTLGTPVVEGREFEPRDTPAAPKAAIVSEALARRYFGGARAIGKWVQMAGARDRMEIVGVVKDVSPRSLRGEIPQTVYLSSAQAGGPFGGGYVLRGDVKPAVLETVLRRIDPQLRLTDFRTMEEHLSRGILQERMMGMLAGMFGALSLLLVCVGVYGVMAFQVARRRKEIGIRMALGARPEQVLRMVLAQTTAPLLLGVAAGVAGALALTRLAEKMLFGVKPDDPLTFAGACAILIALALVAAWIPGRRAARTSPLETLRCE